MRHPQFAALLIFSLALGMTVLPQPAQARDLSLTHDYILPKSPAQKSPAGASAAAAPTALALTAAAVPLAPDGSQLTYTSFDPFFDQFTMWRFNGRHTALLLQQKDLDAAGMAKVRKMLDEADMLYETYREITGAEPSGSDLLVVAIVERSCGGGCGNIGSKGIEILSVIWNTPDYIPVLTHEMLHNYDHFDDLGHSFGDFVFSGGDRAHAWTAAMEKSVPWYLHKGEFGLNTDDAFNFHVNERIGRYENFPGHSWQACIVDVACDPAGDESAQGVALLGQGGVVSRIAQLHGRKVVHDWVLIAKNLITTRGLAGANMTPQDQSDLMVESLGKAAQANISCYFDALNWPVGQGARNALAVFGANSNCVDSDNDGFTTFNHDCQEGNAARRPGAVETVNGIDNDCNGTVDDIRLAEPGDFSDDQGAPQLVPLNSRVTGAITGEEDEDFFRIHLTAPTSVRFTLRSSGFGGFFTVFGPNGLEFEFMSQGFAFIHKDVLLPAGDWVIGLDFVNGAGGYEIIMQSDYTLEFTDYWPVTFTPAPASQTGTNQFTIPRPAIPAALAGTPNLNVQFWVSRNGPVGVIPASAASLVWNAPAGTDPNELTFRVNFLSGALPVHPFSQHQSLLGNLPWVTQNVGDFFLPGRSENFGERDFAVIGNGEIGGMADGFTFVHQQLNGDGEVVARLLDNQGVSAQSKAGVMMRESNFNNARNVFAGLNGSGQFIFQRRTAAGAQTLVTSVPLTAPRWVRLVRSGNIFVAFHSTDGANWTQVGSETIAMPAALFTGLAVSSFDPNLLNTGNFDKARVVAGSFDVGLPMPWQTADLGNVGVTGSAAFAAGNFTVKGSGADIFGTSDAFRFVYQAVTNDADIRARVTSLQNTHSSAKAGVMIRENLTANSAHAFMMITPGAGAAFQRRTVTGGASSSTGIAATIPKWVRVTRVGDTFNGFVSDDGNTWTLVASQNIPMFRTVYMGMAVTSHNNSVLTQAVLSNVSAVAVNPWTRTDIGAVGVPGTSIVDAVTVTVGGSGADIFGTADAFTFLRRNLSGDGFIQARMANQQPTNPFAKAGVMIREANTAGSKNVFIAVTPQNGIRAQVRSATGGTTANAALVAGTQPQWLRVERAGTTFRTFRSTDGVNFTLTSTSTVTMGTNIFMGFAVTSHNNAQLSTCVFDNIKVQE